MTLEWTFRDGTTTTDVIEWALRYEDYDYRQIALTEQGDWTISTIWQGMPAFLGEPRTYATAVWRTGHKEDLLEWHDPDEESALARHESFKVTLAAGVDPYMEGSG